MFRFYSKFAFAIDTEIGLTSTMGNLNGEVSQSLRGKKVYVTMFNPLNSLLSKSPVPFTYANFLPGNPV